MSELEDVVEMVISRKGVKFAMDKYANIRRDLDEFDGDRRGISCALEESIKDVVVKILEAIDWKPGGESGRKLRYSGSVNIEVIKPLTQEREPNKPATLEEIISSWTGLGGSVTINSTDFFSILRASEYRFEPITELRLLKTGWYATFDKVLWVYVSRRIPVGYYYPGHMPVLHTQEENGQVVQPEIDPRIIAEIQHDLRPFKV